MIPARLDTCAEYGYEMAVRRPLWKKIGCAVNAALGKEKA